MTGETEEKRGKKQKEHGTARVTRKQDEGEELV